MDADVIAKVFDRLDRELWVVTACAESRRSGLVATFVSQASIVPALPRVVVGLARQHLTWELVQAAGVFTLHLLGEEHLDWVWRFGLQSGRTVDKFQGLIMAAGGNGCPRLRGALAWLECRVEAALDTGDRTLFLAQVMDGQVEKDVSPLTLKRLLQLAPAEKLRTLKEDLLRDADADAAAIQAWRVQHGVIG